MENDPIEVVNENRQQHGSTSHGSSQRINPAAAEALGNRMITETSTTNYGPFEQVVQTLAIVQMSTIVMRVKTIILSVMASTKWKMILFK
nr:hypothetical protein [Tanacetum cinerariifolium]